MIRNESFTRFAWIVVAYNLFVILWGAFVRASGSGAGCGNHWPLCNGVVAPQSPTLHTIIEFTHRATSGIDVFLVGALLIWAFRAFPRGNPVRTGALLSAAFLLSEALIGAALVLLERVAKNASGYWSTIHLLNTLTLLGCLTLTAWWSTGRGRLRIRGAAAWMAGVSLAAVALLGISGVIAALGDTLFPARSLAEGFAQDLDPAADIFLKLRVLHPAIALCTAVWLLYYAISNAWTSGWGRRMVAILIAQMVLGGANLLLLAPVWAQILHLLFADLLWITLVVVCAETLETRR
jgi:heme A synthase